MIKYLKYILFYILLFGFWSNAFGMETYEYDLTWLGDLAWSSTQYISSIEITQKSDIIISADFFDCDYIGEMWITFLGTNFKVSCIDIKNNAYSLSSGAWYNIEAWTYELYAETDDLNNKRGVWALKLYVSDSGLIWGSEAVIWYNENEEAKKIYLFKEKDDLIYFFVNIAEVYFLIIIMIFLFIMFSRGDRDPWN